MDYPQDYDTKCLICGKRQFAAVKDVICDECSDPNVSTVTDYIVKQAARIAKLEEALEAITEQLYAFQAKIADEK